MLKHRRFPLVAVLLLAVTAATACGGDDPTDPDDNVDDTATVFIFVPPAGTIVQSVTVPGSFNGWNTSANPMTEQSNGTWRASIEIPAGVIQYKYFINGEWPSDMCNDATWGNATTGRIDADSGECVDDNNGGMNATRIITD